MIESGSSLFYLLHCSAHDRLNTMTIRSFRNIPHGLHLAIVRKKEFFMPFASAHPARTASNYAEISSINIGALPQHIPHGLHRESVTVVTGVTTLPQHIPHGLHQQNRTDAMPQIHAICCELVDSFSDAAKAASALTIFPCSSTVKAIYIAIIDSLGRTIDRFFGANRTEKIC